MIKNVAVCSFGISIFSALIYAFIYFYHPDFTTVSNNTNARDSLLDVMQFITFASLVTAAVPLTCLRLAKAYPESVRLLKVFGVIIIVELIIGYLIIKYNPLFQTALSILVSSSVIAMGWWIQNINHANNARKSHTLNIIMQSRMSASYLDRLAAFTKVYRGNRFISKELAVLGDVTTTTDERSFSNLPKNIRDAYDGVCYLLNYYEFLAQGVKARDLDENLVLQCFSSFMQVIELKAFFIIKLAREKDKSYFEGLIWVLERWGMSSFNVNLAKSSPEGDLGVQIPSNIDELISKRKKKKPKTHSRTLPAN
ncbi:DUF4760 domain-containing protein [Rheinheimera sp. 4Y26]|uniref:DUF4760 domain-containing protein n=1 Tax=Rheinheimera sp. 4Y26 TaxID=2977811 RepID=UPI0021B09C87|nr:DUF4760 domain-containing protein [Rheinheimera sp. 4Y26]MCT6700902.1 DUF4760 domain-containing protein [Rheinheimera sp. 4Y26]